MSVCLGTPCPCQARNEDRSPETKIVVMVGSSRKLRFCGGSKQGSSLLLCVGP